MKQKKANKENLIVKSEPAIGDGLEWPSNFNFKEYFDSYCKALQKKTSKEWLPKKKEAMKQKKNYKDITIQKQDYEKLMNFKREWNCSNLWEVVEELIDYFEADNTEQEDRYYCDNCGDYHD